jgi:hypothetical protein
LPALEPRCHTKSFLRAHECTPLTAGLGGVRAQLAGTFFYMDADDGN